MLPEPWVSLALPQGCWLLPGLLGGAGRGRGPSPLALERQPVQSQCFLGRDASPGVCRVAVRVTHPESGFPRGRPAGLFAVLLA